MNPSLYVGIKKPVFRGKRRNTGFSAATENSLNCNFAVACEEITGIIHTKKIRYNATNEASSRKGAVFPMLNDYANPRKTVLHPKLHMRHSELHNQTYPNIEKISFRHLIRYVREQYFQGNNQNQT